MKCWNNGMMGNRSLPLSDPLFQCSMIPIFREALDMQFDHIPFVDEKIPLDHLPIEFPRSPNFSISKFSNKVFMDREGYILHGAPLLKNHRLREVWFLPRNSIHQNSFLLWQRWEGGERCPGNGSRISGKPPWHS